MYEITEGGNCRSFPECPQGIMDGAYKKEFTENWLPHITEVDRSTANNILPTHILYRVKKGKEKPRYTPKARLLIRGELDAQKNELRTDANTTNVTAIRLVLAVCQMEGIPPEEIAGTDVGGAFLQSDEPPPGRQITVQPPRGHYRDVRSRRIVCKLSSLPCGTAGACRHWGTTCTIWLKGMD